MADRFHVKGPTGRRHHPDQDIADQHGNWERRKEGSDRGKYCWYTRRSKINRFGWVNRIVNAHKAIPH
jgi:hypothetical protein